MLQSSNHYAATMETLYKQVPKIIFKLKKLGKYRHLPAGKLQKFSTYLYESYVLKYSMSLKVLHSSAVAFYLTFQQILPGNY